MQMAGGMFTPHDLSDPTGVGDGRVCDARIEPSVADRRSGNGIHSGHRGIDDVQREDG